MLEFPHVIVGATLATKIGNPLLFLPLVFLSHFLLDIIPHWNPHLNTEIKKFGKISTKTTLIVFLDAFAGLIVGLYLAFRFYPDIAKVVVILLGCFFAVLADLAEAPYFFLGVKNKYMDKLIGFQKRLQFNVPFVPGILTQMILLGICFWLLSQP